MKATQISLTQANMTTPHHRGARAHGLARTAHMELVCVCVLGGGARWVQRCDLSPRAHRVDRGLSSLNRAAAPVISAAVLRPPERCGGAVRRRDAPLTHRGCTQTAEEGEGAYFFFNSQTFNHIYSRLLFCQAVLSKSDNFLFIYFFLGRVYVNIK